MSRLSPIVIPLESRISCTCLLAAVLWHASGFSIAAAADDQPISLRTDVPFTDHVHRHFSDREGLPSDWIYDLVQTRDDYESITTHNALARHDGGIARYDNSRFTIFTSTPLLAEEEVAAPRGDSTVAPASTISAGEGEVLVLYGLTSHIPVYVEWSRGIREGLRNKQGNLPTLNVEFLDLARYNDRQHTQMWLDLMRHKYSQRDIRVVIPVLEPALRFARTHVRELFPEAAIVFASVDEREASNAINDRGVTGIAYRADIGKTCELALQLHPLAKRVVCISGSSAIGKSLDELARRELEPLKGRLDVAYWHGVGLDELKRRVRELPADHVVLFMMYLVDENGRDYVPAEAVASLCDESPVPVFALHRTLLDHGVLGGHMVDFDAQAVAAGRMARQVLDGEDPNSLAIRGHELNRPVVHWQRLQHWNVPESNVRSHVTILHREPTWNHEDLHYKIAVQKLNFIKDEKVFLEASSFDCQCDACPVSGC